MKTNHCDELKNNNYICYSYYGSSLKVFNLSKTKIWISSIKKANILKLMILCHRYPFFIYLLLKLFCKDKAGRGIPWLSLKPLIGKGKLLIIKNPIFCSIFYNTDVFGTSKHKFIDVYGKNAMLLVCPNYFFNRNSLGAHQEEESPCIIV